MNELDKLIKKLISEKGGSQQDYLNLLNSIAYHESAGTLDPTIKQYGGGPGRGLFQFEEGSNAGGITAARRTKKYYENNNIPVPTWLKEANSKNTLDASNLTKEQQEVLFLGNMRMHPKADFSKVWKGEESTTDFWANYHWAGNKEDRRQRVKSFNESLNKYKENSIKQPEFDYGANLKQARPKLVKTLNNTFKCGGKMMEGGLLDKSLNSYNTGGLHHQNPYGGVSQGYGNNGNINTVEQGETSFNIPNIGKYIFSNRIKL